jgi:hypothetical protein
VRTTTIILTLILTGCSTATYTIRDPKTHQVLQTVKAAAPGGDAYIVAVYSGANMPPIIQAGGDSTALVEATAAAGRRAIDLVIKAKGL